MLNSLTIQIKLTKNIDLLSYQQIMSINPL